MRKLFVPRIILFLVAIFLIELLVFYTILSYRNSSVIKQYELKIKVGELGYEKEKKKLNDEFEKNKYLATGKDAYERIYNSQVKDIKDLIHQLAVESLPTNWKVEVKVEEFTNFILLIQIDPSRDESSLQTIAKYLIPMMPYVGDSLKNVAVFNKKHHCYLFFDEVALNQLARSQAISEELTYDVIEKGKRFTRYNSVQINFQEMRGHIFLPAVVSGVECTMMLDTGASNSVISLELAQKTGSEDLNKVSRRKFYTAKGELSCPIVEREILVNGIGRKQSVAVNPQDDLNLLGVDFFESKEYMIDSASKCIYVWDR